VLRTLNIAASTGSLPNHELNIASIDLRDPR